MMTTTFRYYPQFFRANRPYAKQLEEALSKARREHTITPKTSFSTVADLLLKSYSDLGVKPTDPGFSLQEFSQESAAALTYGQWWHDGSEVFEFEPALSEAFLRSDVDEIHISDLNFPCRCFYMHFGKQEELPLYDGELYAEGAYLIYEASQSVRVILASRYEGADRNWAGRVKENYQLKIDARHFDIDLGTAIDQALADDLDELHTILRSKASPAPHPLLDAAANVVQYIEAHKQNQETFRKTLRLVVNGLSYLTAYPGDVRQTWQPGTPEKLQLKADKAPSAKERERARSKLMSQGFSPVRLVGGEFQEAAGGLAGDVHRRAHWRRGHWRRQAHGPQLSLRKLIWIQPARISGSGSEA